MTSGEMEDGGIGTSSAAKMEEGPLREDEESRDGGTSGGSSRTRERGLADTDPGPRIARPDGMRSSGPRKLTNREMDTPEIDSSEMVGRVARDEGSIESYRGGGNGEEELTEPEVRDNKESLTRYHASEIGVMESDRVSNAGKLVGSSLDAARNIPLSEEISVRDGEIADTDITSTAEGVPQGSIAGPEGSKGRPVGPNNGAKVICQSSEGPKR